MDERAVATSQEAARRTKCAALTEALEGKREFTWAIWASPINESEYLTAEGRRVAEWAVDILRGYLGEDFLQRVRAAGAAHALLATGEQRFGCAILRLSNVQVHRECQMLITPDAHTCAGWRWGAGTADGRTISNPLTAPLSAPRQALRFTV